MVAGLGERKEDVFLSVRYMLVRSFAIESIAYTVADVKVKVDGVGKKK